jgi:hypothetical protein
VIRNCLKVFTIIIVATCLGSLSSCRSTECKIPRSLTYMKFHRMLVLEEHGYFFINRKLKYDEIQGLENVLSELDYDYFLTNDSSILISSIFVSNAGQMLVIEYLLLEELNDTSNIRFFKSAPEYLQLKSDFSILDEYGFVYE